MQKGSVYSERLLRVCTAYVKFYCKKASLYKFEIHIPKHFYVSHILYEFRFVFPFHLNLLFCICKNKGADQLRGNLLSYGKPS